MSVVGFDIGNDTSTVAVARRRTVDVLQNSSGKRKTASLVAFNEEERVLGDDAAAQMGQNFKNTVAQVKRFLGLRHGSADAAEEAKYTPVPEMHQVSPVGDGTVGFKVRYSGDQQVLPAEQITACLLERLKGTAEAGLGMGVQDCVVAVPPFWTDAQRRAMLDACRLCDLNVLRLMNETTAVALQYGILRPLPEKETRHVLFVDVGHSATNVACVAFKHGRLDVLATASDRHLGARNFDRVLFDRLAADIKEKYKLDVNENAKARMKLFKECARVKKVLSANQFCPYNIEYLMNDTDVSGQVKREEFEAMCADVRARIRAPLEAALATAKVNKSDLYAVEVVGGGVRIPMVLAELTGWFGRDVSRTCDGDESVARGCALQCAMLSPSFKVRDFDVHDITPYPVDVTWGPVAEPPSDAAAAAETEGSARLFAAGNAIPSVKLLSFKDREGSFQVEARYGDEVEVPGGAPSLAGRYVVSGVDAAAAKLKVKFKVDIHGITSVSKAHQIVETEVEVEEPIPAEEKKADEAAPAADAAAEAPMDVDESSASSAAGDDAAAPEESTASTVAEESVAADGGAASDEAAAEPAAEAAAAEPAKPATRLVKKKKAVKTYLTVAPYLLGGLSEDEFKATYEREAAMGAQDRLLRETAERRNEVESYVYEMRSSVQDGDLREFCKDAERDAFVSALDEAESWLYDDGAEAQKSVYVERLQQLQKLGAPISARRAESVSRDEAVTHLKAAIVRYELEAASQDEKFEHIDGDERAKVAQHAAAADDWLQGKLQAQQALTKADDPAVTRAELDAKAREVEAFCAPIMGKPKPAPKKEEPKKEEEEADADKAGDAEKADAEMAPADGDAAEPAAEADAAEPADAEMSA